MLPHSPSIHEAPNRKSTNTLKYASCCDKEDRAPENPFSVLIFKASTSIFITRN